MRSVTDRVAWSVGLSVTLVGRAKRLNPSRCRLGCRLGWAQVINRVRLGSKSPYGKGQFLGKGAPIVKYRDFLPWGVQKRMNGSILVCGLGCAEGSTSSIVFARWRQCDLPLVDAMPPHVKLLWSLVIIRLHCSTMYRLDSAFCLSVSLSH